MDEYAQTVIETGIIKIDLAGMETEHLEEILEFLSRPDHLECMQIHQFEIILMASRGVIDLSCLGKFFQDCAAAIHDIREFSLMRYIYGILDH